MKHEKRQERSWLGRLINHHRSTALANDRGESSTTLCRVESVADLNGSGTSEQIMMPLDTTQISAVSARRFRMDLAELLLVGTHRVRHNRPKRRKLRYTLFPFT